MMLGCIHHVSWLIPGAEKQWRCNNCKAVVSKKEVYPKWEDLGPDFSDRWDLHERGEAVPPPVTFTTTNGGLTVL